MSLLKRCKTSGSNCLLREIWSLDWLPSKLDRSSIDSVPSSILHQRLCPNATIETDESHPPPSPHWLPTLNCMWELWRPHLGSAASTFFHSWCPRGSAHQILAPVGSCRDSALKHLPSSAANLAVAGRSNSWSYNFGAGCTMNYLPESAGFTVTMHAWIHSFVTIGVGGDHSFYFVR